MSIDVEPTLDDKQATDDDNSIAIIDPDVDLTDESVSPKPKADDCMLLLPPHGVIKPRICQSPFRRCLDMLRE
jgi:hypothetical protein